LTTLRQQGTSTSLLEKAVLLQDRNTAMDGASIGRIRRLVLAAFFSSATSKFTFGKISLLIVHRELNLKSCQFSTSRALNHG
jgi:hypothetical protein